MFKRDSNMDGAEAYLSTFNFTGGYPVPADLAPSIVFLVVYVLILPVVIYRWVDSRSRTVLLIRPTIFVAVRIATWVLRAVMTKVEYDVGELVAELVLVSVGYLFLLSPVIDMWKRHVLSCVPKSEHPRWLRKGTTFAQITLFAAIIVAIAGSSLVGTNTSSTLVQGLRKASYVLSLAVVVMTLIGIAYTHVHYRHSRLELRGTTLLLAVCSFCLVVGVYRVVQIFATNPKAPVRSLAAFYVLQGAFEVLALLPIVAVRLPEWFPGEPTEKDTPRSEDMVLKSYPGGRVTDVEAATSELRR